VPTSDASPVEAMFAAEPRLAEHPAVRAADRIATHVLAPNAEAADDPARGVDPDHLARLAAHGLLSIKIPVAEGGHGADDRIDAETVELISGACGATWFVATQHRFPQGMSRGPLPGMPAEAVGRGPPAVRATPTVRGSWTLHGTADWCTGWGMLDFVMIAASTPDDRFVFALLPAREQPGLRASPPLPLAVMGGTRTVGLELDGLAVAADDVLATMDAELWRVHDAARTANTTPAALGLLRRIMRELHALGARRNRPEAVDAALAMAGRTAACRSEAYALLTGVPMMERLAERTALRAEVGQLTVRAANALVAARSGSSMLLTSPEQRWVREAAFHLVQAQTATVRVAQLAALAGS